MRIIKFRGKRLDTGEWVYGYFYEECGNTYIIEDRQHLMNDICTRNIPFVVTPETIGQFTTLYDKNGKEIYEGDIISWRGENLVVKFQEGVFVASLNEKGFISDFYLKNIPCLYVVGNVFDNSELLKGGNE